MLKRLLLLLLVLAAVVGVGLVTVAANASIAPR
jgi:hypothetical protein